MRFYHGISIVDIAFSVRSSTPYGYDYNYDYLDESLTIWRLRKEEKVHLAFDGMVLLEHAH